MQLLKLACQLNQFSRGDRLNHKFGAAEVNLAKLVNLALQKLLPRIWICFQHMQPK
uniref:Uncharacterized protein n=1 Tax=Arundo donax TaxID=35708 RepID=A0A0A9HUZ5_ARUDO